MKLLITALVLLISSVSSQYPALNVIVMKGNQTETLPLSSLDTTLSASSLYNSTLKTVIFFPGWTATPTDIYALQLKNALESVGGYNFLLADWSAYSAGLYFIVGSNLDGVANSYGAKLSAMITAGQLSLTKWHFMGFSFGAHLAGSTGRRIMMTSAASAYVVPRITGLDPAGPFIYPPNLFLGFYQGLRASDGKNSKYAIKF